MQIFSHSVRVSSVAVLVVIMGLTLPNAVWAGPGEAGHGHGGQTIGERGKASKSTRIVQIKLIDNAYEPESIQVKPGETVKFVLRNDGQLLHEFNIGTAEMHAVHQKEMAMMMEHGMLTPTGVNDKAMNMDHSTMPGMAHSMKHDDPNSVLVPPGQTKELTWKFAQGGKIEFACNIPGHYESGMVGNVKFQR
ncbi:cupredoxin domain-containing protein [Skermanella mucosa]|uniref:cupredoxin domain-containing protein n=1 Tax=Skermanella mucosa TaxID=1789672 RepID=UPI001E42B35D|nr:plastocyanin/azurin family copper-binding protein [Skermanella mucosa]UEM21348.1 cupredoxin domain-containing protein [Skermanella mucosa]